MRVETLHWGMVFLSYDSCSQGPMDFNYHRFHVSDWVVLARAGRLVITSLSGSDVIVMKSEIESIVGSKTYL